MSNAKMRELVRMLVSHRSEFKPHGFNRRNPLYEKGDEDAPFGSEAFLYPLLGKDSARTVIYVLTKMCEEVGLDLDNVIAEADDD